MIWLGYLTFAGQVVRLLLKRSGFWVWWSGCGLISTGRVQSLAIQGFACKSGPVVWLSGSIDKAQNATRACVLTLTHPAKMGGEGESSDVQENGD